MSVTTKLQTQAGGAVQQASIRVPAGATEAERFQFFRAHIRLFPQVPGVYKMLDEQELLIYIGKAKNLRHRVASYFHNRLERLVTQILVARIHAIDYLVTITEREALILENTLIKRHQPFFNIDLKDNKTYPYLWLTTHEKFPRLLKTRELTQRGTYFGPFTDVNLINIYATVINSLYPLKKCTQTRFPKGFRPCLYYHIGKCLDYCTGSVSVQRVAAMYREIKELLNGNVTDCITQLETKMRAASTALQYERALALRNAITTLKAMGAKQTVNTLNDDNFDVFHYTATAGWLVIAALAFRQGRLVDKEIFRFNNAFWTTEPTAHVVQEPLPELQLQSAASLQFVVEAFSQFFFEYYQRPAEPIVYIVIPDDLFAAHGAYAALLETITEALYLRGDVDAAAKKVQLRSRQAQPATESAKLTPRLTQELKDAARNRPSPKSPPLTRGTRRAKDATPVPAAAPNKQPLRVPKLLTALKGAKKRLLRLAKANAEQSFHTLMQEHHQQLQLKHLKESLNLTRLPEVIEAFDVANTEAQGLVAACVRFTNGRPDKTHYRLFNIRSTQLQNDFLSIAEAVFRRYRRLLAEHGAAQLPALILIDGGKGQLNAAAKSLHKLNVTQPQLISLAKQEETLFIAGRKQPLQLSETNPALRYLVQIRDEVHRFVNKHHRQQRAKELLQSRFAEVPGLGPKKLQTLLTHYDSLEALKQASQEAVTNLPYIGVKDYQALQRYFKQTTATTAFTVSDDAVDAKALAELARELRHEQRTKRLAQPVKRQQTAADAVFSVRTNPRGGE